MILAGQLASEQDIQRFHREAEAAANLDHSGIVPIYEIGENDGQHFFSMKLVEGGSLAEQMPELRKNIRKFTALIEQVARAVHYAHQRGILHRDLKPANILLDESGHPIVTDLGLARSIESGDSDITRTGAVVGTPAYMPPEQAAAKKDMTTAVDIYAIGAMLYEALTGRPPHVGDSPVETLMKVMQEEIVPPHTVDRKVNPLLERICMKCLEKDPNQRYASAVALADDIANWLAGRPISVRRPSITTSVAEVIKSNLRSAVGAAIVGAVAGIVVAFCISRCNMKPYFKENPPDAIYAALPGDIPLGRYMVFLQEYPARKSIVQTAGFTWLASMMFVGAVVAIVVRPKPGTESIAFGLIAGMFMGILLFTLNVGFNAADYANGSLAEPLSDLTQAAIGPAEAASDAEAKLFESYPGLKDIPAEERSHILTYRIMYDGMFKLPIGLALAMVMATLMTVFPCLVGTAFASKLMHESDRRWWRLPAYIEMMGIVIVLVVVGFLAIFLPATGSVSSSDRMSHWIMLAIFYSFLITMAIITFRGSLRWYWRLAMYPAFLLVMIIVTQLTT